MALHPPWHHRSPFLHLGTALTTDGLRVLSRSICFTSSSNTTLVSFKWRNGLPCPHAHGPRRLLHFSPFSVQPKYFHYSRPDFLPVAPSEGRSKDVVSTLEEASHSLYLSRYLPDQDFLVLDLPPSDRYPLLSSLIAALEGDDANAAWTHFNNLSSDWSLTVSDDDAFSIRDRLWWVLAKGEIREQTMQQSRLSRLLALSSLESFRPIFAPRLYHNILVSLHKQRLLYLLIVHLEEVFRSIHVPEGQARARLVLPKADSEIYTGVTQVINSLHTLPELIDVTLFPRVLYQLAVHGRPQAAIQVYKDQLAISLAIAENYPHRLRGLNSRITEAIFDSLALGPERRIRADSLADDSHHAKPEEAVRSALELINFAVDNRVDVDKQSLGAWMKHASPAFLWSLLPAEIIEAASGVSEPWALVASDKVGSGVHPLATIPIQEDAKHLLCDDIASRLAWRGDIRTALALQRFDRTSGTVGPSIRSAVIRGLSINIRRLMECSDIDTRENTLQMTRDALNTLLDTYHGSMTTPAIRRQSLRDATAAIDALDLVITSEGRSLSPKELSLNWLNTLRRFSSSLLAFDPSLESLTLASNSKLIKLHAMLEDYVFVKDFWVKFVRRATPRPHFSGSPEPGLPAPLTYHQFGWFLTQTLDRRSRGDILFAVQLYLDWQALRRRQDVSTLAPFHIALFIRRLAQSGMTHIIRRVVLDMKQQRAPVTTQIARVLVEAFHSPDAESAEQSIGIVEELIEMFNSHEETLLQVQQSDTGHSSAQQPSFLPLEIFGNVFRQTTSHWMEDWNHRWYIRMLDLFTQFLRALSTQLAYRSAQATAKTYRGGRLAEEAVRQAFNGAMRAQAEWPILKFYTADQEDELACLLADLSSDRILNADLVAESPRDRGASPTGGPLPTTPSIRGEARRGAILELANVLEAHLSVAGDSETWSLKVFAWLLPGDPGNAKDRLSEALKVYEESLEAEFDFNPDAVLKPWARLPRSFSIGGPPESENSSTFASSTSDKGPTPIASPHQGVHVPNDAAIMKRVRVRSRTAARLILTLARSGEFDSASWVYETALQRLKEESKTNGIRGSDGNSHSTDGMDTSNSSPSRLSSKQADPNSIATSSHAGHLNPSHNRAQSPALHRIPARTEISSHSIRYARVIALILEGQEEASRAVWEEVWSSRRHILLKGVQVQRELTFAGLWSQAEAEDFKDRVVPPSRWRNKRWNKLCRDEVWQWLKRRALGTSGQ